MLCNSKLIRLKYVVVSSVHSTSAKTSSNHPVSLVTQTLHQIT